MFRFFFLQYTPVCGKAQFRAALLGAALPMVGDMQARRLTPLHPPAICAIMRTYVCMRCAMEGQIRVSVRNLVEFSIHGEDIFSVSSRQDMLAGTQGHKARQEGLGDGWQAETPLSLTAEAEGIPFLITGRMDAYCDADIPTLEEFKLCRSGEAPPREALPAHRAQAAVYGHMLCAGQGKAAVRIRVTYVTETGALCACFEKTRGAQELEAEFLALLSAYAKWENLQRKHRAARDESLARLPFPFDRYRPGQREMAVQVFTAIRTKRRLFASMPTGTGKSAAVLYPALKALGQGLTGQIFYLTARTTARQAALQALDLMREKGLHARSLTLNSKDKQCPGFSRCHPDYCPRARRYFLRLPAALDEILQTADWNAQAVTDMAEKHSLCPFEFALTLCEIADVVICDYNYAFDPVVRIKRVFEQRSDLTLLVDESHNLASRTRDMLSGVSDGETLRNIRRMLGRASGRTGPLYKAITGVLRALREIRMEDGVSETELTELPEGLQPAVQGLLEALAEAFAAPPQGEAGQALGELFLSAINFTAAANGDRQNYAILCRRQGKERSVKLLCLSVAEHLMEATRRLSGIVYFSATLSPLHEMLKLLGGGEEDACFALPSPFPPENLRVVRHRIDTRYALRRETAPRVAEAIVNAFAEKPGKYIAYFPSYAYLRLVAGELEIIGPSLPLLVQRSGMADDDREAFLARFTLDADPLLGLAVLGGVFAEGIDLPGERLLGVMVVGVGLPMVCREQEALRRHYEQTLGDGFAYAYRYPGMHKVLQAAGRVIRSETDKGTVLLIDKRYFEYDYVSLCPAHWRM